MVSFAEQLDNLRAEHAAQLDAQSAAHQEELMALRQELEAQESETLQSMETTVVEMEEMQLALENARVGAAYLPALHSFIPPPPPPPPTIAQVPTCTTTDVAVRSE